MEKNSENQDNFDKRILIYDDNLEILRVCKMFLTKYQYQVKTNSSCEDVINDVINFNPHFILMDLWMPEIGGEKAVELLKANYSTKNIPVFLFSANPHINEIRKRVKANGFIAKPFNFLEFKETIENQIRIYQTT